MKLAVLGGGGVRAVFLARAVLNRADKLSIDQIVFMDNDVGKLRIYGGLSREIARRINPKIEFTLTCDVTQAVDRADYIITALRVGNDEARILDERVALSHGVLGQETTGAGGFAMAARTIPVLKEYMAAVSRHASPGAIVFNFTNPSGMITQALRDDGYDNVFGICDAPREMIKQIAHLLDVPADSLAVECYGLNHLSWIRSVRFNGREMIRRILSDPRLCTDTDERVFEPDLIRLLGMLQNEYLYFYYYREKAVENILRSGKTRGETILELNTEMFRELSALDPVKNFEQALSVYLSFHDKRNKSYMSIELEGHRKDDRNIVTQFSLSEHDDGGYAGVALNMIESLVTGNPCEMILSVPNMGAIEGVGDSDVVEISCIIGKSGAYPKRIGRIPDTQLQLIRQIKLYEKLSIQAISQRSKTLAVQALMANPLVYSYPTAKAIIDDYLKVHEKFMHGWS